MRTVKTQEYGIVLTFMACVVLLMIHAGTVQSQVERTGDKGDLGSDESNFPEEVATFHRTFLKHYMTNQGRISDLRAIRSAGDRQQAQEVEGTVREQTNETLSELRNLYQAAREKGTGTMVLNSMRKLLEIYPLYINKVLSDWEPSDQQVLKRRRMSDNEIVQEQPQLAGAPLLRRVFLGELISSAQSVPEMEGWFDERISKVRSWIRSKYNELFPLFIRLVSRVDRVMNSDDKTDEEQKQVMQEVQTEWNQYWRDVGEGTTWHKMRRRVNRLRSLFRDRSNRLPGGQEMLKEDVQRLQKKIGNLQRIKTKKPFASRANRLEAMLQLSKAFVNRAKELGDSQESKGISTISMMFFEDHMDPPPKQVWQTQEPDQLKEQKKAKLEEINSAMVGLRYANFKEERKKYNFPIDAIQNIVSRLGTNYGKQEQSIAEAVRDMSQYVQAMYQLSTEGVDLMTSYQDALKEISIEQPNQMVNFERAFREKHQSSIQNLKGKINTIREMRDQIDKIVNHVRDVKPGELAAAYTETQKKKDQTSSDK